MTNDSDLALERAAQHTLVLEKLTALEAHMTAMADLLQTIVGLLEQLPAPRHPAPEVPTLKVASYDEMYGPIEPAPAPAWTQAPIPRPLGRVRRWFFKE